MREMLLVRSMVCEVLWMLPPVSPMMPVATENTTYAREQRDGKEVIG